MRNRRPKWLTIECDQCGAPFRRTAGAAIRTKRHFCSRACAEVALAGRGSTMFRGGRERGRGPGWLVLAERIRARDGRACRRCGKTQQENGRKLSVDHVVPWREFDDKAAANAEGNLVALCASCHSKKTSRAEQRYLRGDRHDFVAYIRAVSL